MLLSGVMADNGGVMRAQPSNQLRWVGQLSEEELLGIPASVLPRRTKVAVRSTQAPPARRVVTMVSPVRRLHAREPLAIVSVAGLVMLMLGGVGAGSRFWGSAPLAPRRTPKGSARSSSTAESSVHSRAPFLPLRIVETGPPRTAPPKTADPSQGARTSQARLEKKGRAAVVVTTRATHRSSRRPCRWSARSRWTSRIRRRSPRSPSSHCPATSCRRHQPFLSRRKGGGSRGLWPPPGRGKDGW
jgi:hypothetical protein